MNKNTKIMIIIICALFAFLLVVFLLQRNKAVVFSSSGNEAYLVVGQNAMFAYHSNKFYNVPDNSKVKEELDWHKFIVYSNYKKIGQYQLHYDDTWYLFDDKENSIDYDKNNFLAFASNYDINFIHKKSNDILEDKYVEKVVRKHGLELDNLTVSEELYMDIDNDQNNETFYIVSTAFPIVPTNKQEYSIVIMVKDSKIIKIYDNLDNNYYKDICKPKIEGFTDLNKNKQYEVIVSCSNISIEEQLVYLYEYNDSNFKLLASNQ